MNAWTFTPAQKTASERLKDFLQDPCLQAFVLAGYAGTGKTYMVRWLCQHLTAQRWTPVLLAPTGRAARILSERTGEPAQTIHSAIYNLSRVEALDTEQEEGVKLHFRLCANPFAAPCFVIDEASMVSDTYQESEYLRFGSGRLLADLLRFARDTPRFKIIWVGDPAQLPPVKANISPAMACHYLEERHQLAASAYCLSDVVRQDKDSAILENAQRIRLAIEQRRYAELHIAPADAEVIELKPSELVREYLEIAADQGFARVVAIVYSNAQALLYNRSIRQRRWGDGDGPVRAGELLMVNQNNMKTGLMNGDFIRVAEVDPVAEQVDIALRGRGVVSLSFRQMTLRYRTPSGEVAETCCKVLQDLLFSNERGLSPAQQSALYVHFRQRHPALEGGNALFATEMRDDPYYQALQVKFGYAITCHKAQGGEWDNVFVHVESGRGMQNETFFRWFYTAVTRARKTLRLVNAPHFSAISQARLLETETLNSDSDKPMPEDGALVFESSESTLAQMRRFNFPTHAEHLRIFFSAFTQHIAASGMTISAVHHGQYHERYRISAAGEAVTIQVYYDGKNRFTRVVPVVSDAQRQSALLQAVQSSAQAAVQLANMRGLLEHGLDDPQSWPEPTRHLVAQLAAPLHAKGISINRREALQWCERLYFQRHHEVACFDFYYNAKAQWTRIAHSKQKDSAAALTQEVQAILKHHIEKQQTMLNLAIHIS
jgi:hypothetical protein